MKVFTRIIISFETLNISESINFHSLIDKCLKKRVYKTFLMEMHRQNGWIYCLKGPVPRHWCCDLGKAWVVKGPQSLQMLAW